MRAEFTRSPGKLAVRDGVVWGPAMGATIEGNFDYARDEVRLRGTFVPAYALNNFLARVPVVGLFLGGGQNEGVFGMTYEVVGPTGNATLRVNPIVHDGAGLPAQDLRVPQRRRQQGRAAVFLADAVAVIRSMRERSGASAELTGLRFGGDDGELHRLQQHVLLAAERELDHAFGGQVLRRQRHLLVGHASRR